MNEVKKRSFDLFAKTDKGLKRPNNEDEAGFLDRENMKLVLVADGMGGHQSGEIASRIAREMIIGALQLQSVSENMFLEKRAIKKAIKKANSQIHSLSAKREECYGMGTTLVMGIRLNELTLIVNCGDSRAYSYNRAERKLVQLTTDQTIVEYLYRLGAISKEDMKTNPKRHVLMNALGISVFPDFEMKSIPNDYDLLFCCSDGLTNMVEDSRIEEILYANPDKGASDICQALINEAIANGGIDNIGVSVMEVR